MNKPKVWVETGAVIINGASIDTAPHSHHAVHIIWPTESSHCYVAGREITTAVIIDSNVEHQLKMTQGWIILIEPNSDLGKQIIEQLEGQPFKEFSFSNSDQTWAQNQNQSLITLFAPLLNAIGIDNLPMYPNKGVAIDPRIQKLLTELDQCLHGECLKPANWRASQVASQLALSESRFLHLFSEQLGIAWRPYLLWRRMLCAVQALNNKVSATEAAHLAGFSDSAHLSRTFRKTFGITIRQAQALFPIN